MTSSQANDAVCEHEWVNARCAKCAVVSSERRLREFLEQSTADYLAKHGDAGPNGNIDVDLHRAIVSTLVNVADYLERRESRRNPVERVLDLFDWPLRVASVLSLLEKLLKAFGESLKRTSSNPRKRSSSHPRSELYG